MLVQRDNTVTHTSKMLHSMGKSMPPIICRLQNNPEGLNSHLLVEWHHLFRL